MQQQVVYYAVVLALAAAVYILAPIVCPAYGRHDRVHSGGSWLLCRSPPHHLGGGNLPALGDRRCAPAQSRAPIGQGAVRRAPCCYLVRAGTIGLRQLGRQTMLRDGNVEHLRLIAITRCCQRQLRSPVNNQ